MCFFALLTSVYDMSTGKKSQCVALLTYYELARGGGYAILCAMNGFRITILALLVLVVGLMFYVVFVTLPSRQADYNIYQISQQVAQNEREAASHRERISAFGEAAEQNELSSAYAEAEAADREAVRNVSDAEEQSVLAEARRRAEAEPSSEVKKRVDAARLVQRQRFENNGSMCNARMGPEEMRRYCGLSDDCAALMKQAFDTMGLTARSYDRILKVARTVADLEGSETIEPQHIAESIQYRAVNLGNR